VSFIVTHFIHCQIFLIMYLQYLFAFAKSYLRLKGTVNTATLCRRTSTAVPVMKCIFQIRLSSNLNRVPTYLMNFEVAPCGGLILASVAGVLDLLVDGPLVHVQAAHLPHGNKVLSLQCCGSGSGAFLTPGSGMVKNLGSGSGANNPDHISESL
jgi:hypothetical protein